MFSDATQERYLTSAILSAVPPSGRGGYDGCVDFVNYLYRIAFPLGRVAYEERFYRGGVSGTPEAVSIADVFEFAATADRTVECNDFDAIDVGIGHRGSTDFTSGQVRYFLEREKYKGLLVVWFTPGFVWTRSGSSQKVADFKSFVKNLGYRRVLILGGHAEGVFVLYDSAGNEQQQKLASGKRSY